MIRYVTGGLLLVALFSTIGPLGHGALSSSVQHDSLVFTVNPDRSVGIAWNTTNFASTLQNASSIFPPGYAVQSSSSFSQQSNAVVETTNVQYQLPASVYTQIPYSLVNSVSLTATQTGSSGSGSLSVSTQLPVQSLSVAYTTSSTKIEANATAQIYYSPSLASTFPQFANASIFQSVWMKTFGNRTWADNAAIQIQNATRISSTSRILTVTAFNGTVTYPDSSSANVKIGFVAVPSGSATDFVSAAENALTMNLPSGLDSIIRKALSLVTGESASLTYTGSTGKLVVQYTTNFVSDLDSQVNSIKNQYFQFLFSLLPSYAITPQEKFLNATSVTISKISMTSKLDLNAGTTSTSLTGLIISPPTVGTSTNFTIPGLFQTLGSTLFSSPGVNITLVGGSDSNNQVTITVPNGIQQSPSSTTSNSDTWTNVRNATFLQTVRFEVQPVPFSIIGFFTSPPGFAIEAIIAAAIIAGIALYARKRRHKMPSPLTGSGPAVSPSFGPAPTQLSRPANFARLFLP